MCPVSVIRIPEAKFALLFFFESFREYVFDAIKLKFFALTLMHVRWFWGKTRHFFGFLRKFSRIFDAINLKVFALTLISVRRRELHNDTGSEASQESGIFSTGSSQESPRKEAAAGAARRGPGAGQADRRPGLGRRAITQINLKERKNSYNSALARSQENLVQVRPGLFLCSVNIPSEIPVLNCGGFRSGRIENPIGTVLFKWINKILIHLGESFFKLLSSLITYLPTEEKPRCSLTRVIMSWPNFEDGSAT